MSTSATQGFHDKGASRIIKLFVVLFWCVSF